MSDTPHGGVANAARLSAFRTLRDEFLAASRARHRVRLAFAAGPEPADIYQWNHELTGGDFKSHEPEVISGRSWKTCGVRGTGLVAFGDLDGVEEFFRLAAAAAVQLPAEWLGDPPLFPAAVATGEDRLPTAGRWAELVFVANPQAFDMPPPGVPARAAVLRAGQDPFLLSVMTIDRFLAASKPKESLARYATDRAAVAAVLDQNFPLTAPPAPPPAFTPEHFRDLVENDGPRPVLGTIQIAPAQSTELPATFAPFGPEPPADQVDAAARDLWERSTYRGFWDRAPDDRWVIALRMIVELLPEANARQERSLPSENDYRWAVRRLLDVGLVELVQITPPPEFRPERVRMLRRMGVMVQDADGNYLPDAFIQHQPILGLRSTAELIARWQVGPILFGNPASDVDAGGTRSDPAPHRGTVSPGSGAGPAFWISSELLTAKAIAERTGLDLRTLRVRLSEFSERNPGCRIELRYPRRGEERHVYRISEVRGLIENMLKAKRRKLDS